MVPTHQPHQPLHPLSPVSPTSRSYPPSRAPNTPITIHTSVTLQKKNKKRVRTITWRRIRSILYHSSFWLFIAIITALLVGAAWGLGQSAWQTGGQKKWNTIILIAAYAALFFISISHSWSRVLSVKKVLKTMPKPYIPIKPDDISEKVSRHITTEYSRTAVIAHISQATSGQQEGWGRPGTRWEDKHFRSYIISTLPIMREALTVAKDAPPLSLKPFFIAADNIQDKGAVRLLVNSWAQYIEKARYGKREPGEREAGAVERLVEIVVLTMEIKRQKQKGVSQDTREL